MVEVMSRKEADRHRKIAIEASKKNRESLLKTVEAAKKRKVIADKKRDFQDELMDYNKSLMKNKNESIWKDINGMIIDDELTSKSDIDKYIKDNNLLKSDKTETTKNIKEAIKNIEIFLINTKII